MRRLVDVDDLWLGLLDNDSLRFVVQVITAIHRGRVEDVGETSVPVAAPPSIIGG